jgi:hypothetical protein
MANFDNGLTRIDTSLNNGAPGADNAAVAVAKINNNFKQCAPLNGAWLGAGLRWIGGKLTISNTPGTILVGESNYTLSDEFTLANERLSINNISTNKLEGTLAASKIGISNGNLLIGGTGGIGREVELDSAAFTLAGNVLGLRSSVSNSINSNSLALPPNSIPIGTELGGARSVELGSMFSIVDDKLKVSLPSVVNYASIATDAVVGTNPKLLVASTNLAGGDSLIWQTPGVAVGQALNDRLANESNNKRLYVNPVSGNDGFSNRGRSIYTPFKTLERACLEVARSSYRADGSLVNADTVIYLCVGTLLVDNRPGSPSVTVTTKVGLEALLTTGALNYFNPAVGGTIVPRGCSIIGVDVRRSTLIPLYVPDPFAAGQDRSALLRLTGNAFASQFNVTDSPNVNRSHHLLTAFEFVSTNDLVVYYQKVYAAFAELDGFTANNLVPAVGETQLVVDQNSTTIDLNGFKLVDSVSNSSGYIFNVSLRSRFGMCGAFLDGNKVTGIKSLVAAQFTNVSQQVDPNAYVADTSDLLTGQNYKPNYRHFAFKSVNDAYAQLVSCFTICAADHYAVDTGGELSITNSCSNFGGTALVAKGFSSESLVQDRGYAGVRLLPPLAIGGDEREFIIGTLDSANVTPTEISLSILGNLGQLEFINDSYIYVRVSEPGNTNVNLDLQAKFVATGATYTDTPTKRFNVVSGPTSIDENAIYQYLNCLGIYEYQSTWYDSANPPVGGLPAALATEKQFRAQVLLNSNIFVKRVYESRSNRERSYRLLVTVPPSSRTPVVNFVVELAVGVQQTQRFFITDIEEIEPTKLAGDTTCTSLPGKVYALSVLRVNNTGNGEYSDKLEDLQPSAVYAKKLLNLDSRLYNSATLLKEASYDPLSPGYLSTVALLTALGYDNTTISTLIEPTYGATLPERYRCLPGSSAVINSSFPFSLVRPSRIRCSGHTWEWVGYRNYSTALPKLQTNLLTYGQRLAALQASLLGGQVYATGMDEEGALYQGRTKIDLATSAQEQVRYDGQAVKPSSVASSQQRFQDITVTGALTAGQASIDNLTVGMQIFKQSSQFRVNTPLGLSLLVDGKVPAGIIANAAAGTYGLVRKATTTEVENKFGAGYLSPSDLASLGGVFTIVNNVVTCRFADNLRIDVGFGSTHSHNEWIAFGSPFSGGLWYVGVNPDGGDSLRFAGATDLNNSGFRLKMEIFGGSRTFNVSWIAVGSD